MGLFDSFKTTVNTEITVKTDPSSIEPADVGSRFIELCDLLEPELTDIIDIGGSDSDPSGGEDGDVHFKGGVSPVEIHQKISGTWTKTGEITIDAVNAVSENDTATELDTPALNDEYPGAGLGYRVLCPNISLIYFKGTSSWYSLPIGSV